MSKKPTPSFKEQLRNVLYNLGVSKSTMEVFNKLESKSVEKLKNRSKKFLAANPGYDGGVPAATLATVVTGGRRKKTRRKRKKKNRSRKKKNRTRKMRGGDPLAGAGLLLIAALFFYMIYIGHEEPVERCGRCMRPLASCQCDQVVRSPRRDRRWGYY